MAIRSLRNFKTVLGVADLQLTAKPDESILVRDVRIYEPTAVYTNFLIDRTSVGFYRVASLLGNHLHFNPGRAAHSHNMTMGSTATAAAGNGAILEDAGGDELATLRLADTAADQVFLRAMNATHTPDSEGKTLLAYLGEKGLFTGYPVGEGQTFTVQLCTGATAVKVVEYDIYDAGDITPDMENGSKGDSLLYVNYGDSGANIQAAADNNLGESNNPAEYPDFPFGGNVPAGYEIDLVGILASDVAPRGNATGTATYTQYLKFMRGREVLFDEDHNGLLYYANFPDDIGGMNMIAEGYAVGGNYTQCDRKQPQMFEPAVHFLEGQELLVTWHVTVEGAGVAISQELQEVGIILRMNKKP